MEKVLSFMFQQCFSPITMLLVEGSSETGLFRLLSNHVFRGPQVQKYISYEGHFLCGNVQNETLIWKKQNKNCQKVFFSEIIVSQFVAINCVC